MSKFHKAKCQISQFGNEYQGPTNEMDTTLIE